MPLDQAQAGTLRNLATSFLQFLGEEAQEGHHPPNPMQHQQGLGGSADLNEPATYAGQNPQEAGGMLLLAPDGRALFVRRAANARDHAGAWSIPGGGTEGDEMPWETALRETREEVGDIGNPQMQLLDHTLMDNVGFTTFGGKVNDNFTPSLNHEHDAFQWARPDAAPQPLHPGLRSTLDFALDPLTEKGSKIMKSMKEQYGPEKGESVFYASRNKGTISGVDDSYHTTGRQDTQIPRSESPTFASPFTANLDNWASPTQMTTAPNSGAPPLASRRNTDDAGTSAGAKKGWQSRGGGGGGQVKGSFTPQMLNQLRTQMGGIKGIDPSSSAYKGIIDRLDSLNPAQLKQIHEAKIPFMSSLALNRIMRHERQSRKSSGDTWSSPRQDQAGASQHPFSGGKISGSVGDLSRFVLRDQRTGTDYALDKPLSADFKPISDWASPSQEVGEDAGGGAGGWGHAGLTPPTQQGAQAVGDAPWNGGQSDPTAPLGEGGMSPPPLPSGGRGGGMRGGTSQGMPGSGMAMNNGPKLTHSFRAQYPDGSIDERKITRPGGPSMGQSPQDAGSLAGGMGWPEQQGAQMSQPPQQQSWGSPPQDGGWPNSATLGPSPKGGRAGSRGGGIAGRV